jgi:5-methylcytosine-specific restriction endonuclease McrA
MCQEAEMAREFSKSLYNSKAWEETRKAFLKSKFYLCNRCKGTAVLVHHKKYLNENNINDPEITLGWDNLEALCNSCHEKEHGREFEVTREDVTFDSQGNLIKR